MMIQVSKVAIFRRKNERILNVFSISRAQRAKECVYHQASVLYDAVIMMRGC